MKRTTNNYKKNSGATVAIIVSTILILAMAAGLLASLSNGFKDWNVKDWFGKDNTETPDDNKPDDNKTETKERSVAFDLKFDTLNEENGYYTATLTKNQKAALLDYPNTYFFAELSGEYNGEEQAKAKIPMFFFASYDTSEGNIGIGFSDTGSSECNVAFILPILGNDNTGKFEAIAMTELSMSFTLTYAEDSVSIGKPLMDYVKGTAEEAETFSFDINEVNKEVNDSAVYTAYYAEENIESLPEERDYNGKVIFAESVNSATGETFPEKTVDVTWKYSKGSGTANGESVYIHDWTYAINENNGQYDVRLRKIVRKSDNSVMRIEATSHGHGFCTLVFNK